MDLTPPPIKSKINEISGFITHVFASWFREIYYLLTNVNSNGQFVKLDDDGKLPAVDGSLLTNIDHTNLDSIGSNSHSAIDLHIGDGSIHFTEANIDHTKIQNIGSNTHSTIDSHLSDSTIHFTESSIDHTKIQNIGSNSHSTIDSHLSSTSNPHFVTKTQVGLGNVPDVDCTNASNISSGTLNDARLSSNVALKNQDNNFTITQNITGNLIASASVKGGTASFGGAINYAEFEADGTLKLNGDATTFNDLFVEISPKTTGVGKPTLATFSGNINKYTFAVNDITELSSIELLHDWKEGSPIDVHVHWALNGTNDATVRGVKFEIDYTWANMYPQGNPLSFPAATTVSKEQEVLANAVDKTHYYTDIVAITPTGGKIGACLNLSLKRIASVTNPAPANNPFVLMVGVHYERDTLGSRTETSK